LTVTRHGTTIRLYQQRTEIVTMSKVFLAVADGTAKEFKAIVNGKIRFVVDYNGKFYTDNGVGRYIPISKDKVTTIAPSANVVH
jgi:hypothetical protein